MSDHKEDQIINELISRACVIALMHDLDDMTLRIEGTISHSNITITVDVRSDDHE